MRIYIALFCILNVVVLLRRKPVVARGNIPRYAAPHDDSWVVDLKVVHCLVLFACSAPPLRVGKYGEQALWLLVEKDLLLGSSWFWRKQLAVKTVKKSFFPEKKGLLVVNVEIGKPKTGWVLRGNGILLQYGVPNLEAITAVTVLFGKDCVEPRPEWLLVGPLVHVGALAHKPHLSVRRGPRIDYAFRKLPKFGHHTKILQVADLHFSTGPGRCRDSVFRSTRCEADPETVSFVKDVLKLEQPDVAVLTGDQVFGDAAPDAETAVLKAVAPFIEAQIPWAAVLGNHDDEGSMTREQMARYMMTLPFSLSLSSDWQNYNVRLDKDGACLDFLFMDSHSRVENGYDWFKPEQVEWLQLVARQLCVSFAFFHIPLPEYRNVKNFRFSGEVREGIAAPTVNSGMREALGRAGVDVVSVGHDHANDFCFQDESAGRVWLCYGGGAGEGGYGGYGGYVRRLRVFDVEGTQIRTWKRVRGNDERVDEETLTG